MTFDIPSVDINEFAPGHCVRVRVSDVSGEMGVTEVIAGRIVENAGMGAQGGHV